MSTNRNRSRNRPRVSLPGDPEVVGATDSVVLRLPAEDEGEDQFSEREPLFTIGGTEYTVLVQVSAGAGIEYLERQLNFGPDAAIIWAMRYAIGDEGVAALYSYRKLTNEHLAAVVGVVQGKFSGALDGPKVRRSNA